MTQTVEESTIDLYINGFFDTDTNKLAEDQFCTNISQNCNNLVKFYDGSIWNFLSDMDVKFESPFTKCIKMNKDYHFDITTCGEKLAGMVCRLDCCKYLHNIKLNCTDARVDEYLGGPFRIYLPQKFKFRIFSSAKTVLAMNYVFIYMCICICIYIDILFLTTIISK